MASESETDYSIAGAWHKLMKTLQWLAENSKAVDTSGRARWIQKQLEKVRIFKPMNAIHAQLRRVQSQSQKLTISTAEIINKVWTPSAVDRLVEEFKKNTKANRSKY